MIRRMFTGGSKKKPEEDKRQQHKSNQRIENLARQSVSTSRKGMDEWPAELERVSLTELAAEDNRIDELLARREGVDFTAHRPSVE